MTRVFLGAWIALFLLWGTSTYLLMVQTEDLHSVYSALERRLDGVESVKLSSAERAWLSERMAQERAAEEARRSGYLPPLGGLGTRWR